jgi:hypothetical protein
MIVGLKCITFQSVNSIIVALSLSIKHMAGYGKIVVTMCPHPLGNKPHPSPPGDGGKET